MKNLIDINNLDKNNILNILNQAEKYLRHSNIQDRHSRAGGNLEVQKNNTLKNKIIANLFFEPSTRTRVSFEIAAKNLGADVINLDLASSSLTKGESILDTVNTLIAMGVDLFIIRHQENNIPKFIAEHIQDKACIINAGDGTNQHPTQALLDMLTIKHYKKNFEDLNITMIGDIKNSRVANSDLAALKTLGVKNINLVDPIQNPPSDSAGLPPLQKGDYLKNTDVIMLLRIQKERMEKASIPNFDDYFNHYGLTLDDIKSAKSDAIIMHPGPINRGVEISSELADSKQAVILSQVTMGVAVRMALLDLMLS